MPRLVVLVFVPRKIKWLASYGRAVGRLMAKNKIRAVRRKTSGVDMEMADWGLGIADYGLGEGLGVKCIAPGEESTTGAEAGFVMLAADGDIAFVAADDDLRALLHGAAVG